MYVHLYNNSKVWYSYHCIKFVVVATNVKDLVFQYLYYWTCQIFPICMFFKVYNNKNHAIIFIEVIVKLLKESLTFKMFPKISYLIHLNISAERSSIPIFCLL